MIGSGDKEEEIRRRWSSRRSRHRVVVSMWDLKAGQVATQPAQVRVQPADYLLAHTISTRVQHLNGYFT